MTESKVRTGQGHTGYFIQVLDTPPCFQQSFKEVKGHMGQGMVSMVRRYAQPRIGSGVQCFSQQPDTVYSFERESLESSSERVTINVLPLSLSPRIFFSPEHCDYGFPQKQKYYSSDSSNLMYPISTYTFIFNGQV